MRLKNAGTKSLVAGSIEQLESRQLMAAGAPRVTGVLADNRGQIVVSFNTEAMYRGAATAAGRFEVGLFPGECQ